MTCGGLHAFVCPDHPYLPPRPPHRTPLLAARRRTCCRHHLDARARLRNMARARRFASIPRLCVPINRRDVALIRIEVLRVINTGCFDYATARLLLRAMDLTNATFPAEPRRRPRRPQKRASNPNRIYDVPLTPKFARTLPKILLQVIENTDRQGGGHAPIARTLAPASHPPAPIALNRSERRRLAALTHSGHRMTKSERRKARRKQSKVFHTRD